ncbi:MAG: transcriptional repressor [Clostridia bacterium]|nr:transcriptional repressor [Clostridia bacterium]
MQERQTRQKSIIYDALKGLDHPTATEVYVRLQETHPTISRATVFRVLGGFAQNGRAVELRLAGKDVRYDYNVEQHYHVHCKECGRVADIFLPVLSGIGEEIKMASGFSVEGCTVEFFGVCPTCKEKIS